MDRLSNCDGTNKLFGDETLVVLPAMNGMFVARDHFVESTKLGAAVRISHLSGCFKRNYLDGVGKIEDPLGPTVLSYRPLLSPAIDLKIIDTLGGKDQVQTSLRQIFNLLQKQSTGSLGALQTHNELSGGYGNIFYVPDMNGVLRNVLASWQVDAWVIGSLDIAVLRSKWNEWEFGNQVFYPRPHPLSIYA